MSEVKPATDEQIASERGRHKCRDVAAEGKWFATEGECLFQDALIARIEQDARIKAGLVGALEPFAEPHAMGDHYVQFAPRLIHAARAALSAAKGESK